MTDSRARRLLGAGHHEADRVAGPPLQLEALAHRVDAGRGGARSMASQKLISTASGAGAGAGPGAGPGAGARERAGAKAVAKAAARARAGVAFLVVAPVSARSRETVLVSLWDSAGAEAARSCEGGALKISTCPKLRVIVAAALATQQRPRCCPHPGPPPAHATQEYINSYNNYNSYNSY